MMEHDLLAKVKELDELEALEKKPPAIMRNIFRLRKQVRRLELNIEWQGADPRKIPKDVIKEIMNDASGSQYADRVEEEYRERIRNRATAIRANCVSCMAGQPGFVRGCEAISCELWPFRMGKDPFRGYDIPKMHVEIDKETANTKEGENDDMFDDTDDDTGDEAIV